MMPPRGTLGEGIEVVGGLHHGRAGRRSTGMRVGAERDRDHDPVPGTGGLLDGRCRRTRAKSVDEAGQGPGATRVAEYNVQTGCEREAPTRLPISPLPMSATVLIAGPKAPQSPGDGRTRGALPQSLRRSPSQRA